MFTINPFIQKEKVFEGQHTKEEVISIIHRHWYALFWPVVKVFFGLVIVFILFRLFGASKFSAYALLLWLIIGGVYILINWFNWARDRYILTDERVINLQQKSLFSRAVYEAPYENIQDLSYEINGFWATFFRFGNVRVQTAGTKEGIVMEQVARPRRLKSKIVKIRDILMKDRKKDSSTKELVALLKKELEKK
jgi:membrane protein YdbS with pleckstrin-like domain